MTRGASRMTDALPSSVGTFHSSRRTYRFTVLLFAWLLRRNETGPHAHGLETIRA